MAGTIKQLKENIRYMQTELKGAGESCKEGCKEG